MRKGFTLIELMIVIAIIAIIAAIAVPNLLESRVSSQESAAAAALKAGVFTGQVGFQAGNYVDKDGDGIGSYAVSGASVTLPWDALSGGETVGAGISLTLLAPTYRGATPEISGYSYASPVTETAPTASADNSGEKTWGAHCYPASKDDGRRYFGISQGGNVYSSKPSSTSSADGASAAVTDSAFFGTSLVSKPATATYVPYRR